jgi:hypothetical protein
MASRILKASCLLKEKCRVLRGAAGVLLAATAADVAHAAEEPAAAAAAPEAASGAAPVAAPLPSSEPAATTATPQPATATDPATAALLESLGAGDAAELDLDEPKLNLYGFADFTYFTQVGKAVAFSNEHATFMVGNFNVYLSSEFAKNWRSLGEVRFMYLPDGSYAGESPFTNTVGATRTDTSVLDGSNLNRSTEWGGISIQRIWVEHKFDGYLTLRAGQWLTPYGIWNVDHGSPAIVNIYRPYVIDQNLFPEQQTGLEAYGAFLFGDTKLGYHLTLSNGRGPVDSYMDLDHNKAVGGRLYVQNDALLGSLMLGVSAYRGRYTDRPGNGTAIEDGKLVRLDPPTARYDELAFAVDARWQWQGLQVQSEFVLSETAYSDALRPGANLAPPPPQPAQLADTRVYGLYGLVAYRTPYWNIMPFVLAQYFHAVTASKEIAVGVNVRPVPNVALKAEYKYIFIDDAPGIVLGDLDFLGLQVAWSF